MSDTKTPKQPILIVDDEEIILMTMDTILKMSGIDNVITCQDGRMLMDILKEYPVEVLLLDLNMPHITGEELLGRVNQEYPEIPIIVVTGAVDVDTAVRCMKTGAFDYVVKPVERDRLVTAVYRAIEVRELKCENLALKHHILSETLEHPEVFTEIVTKNKKMLQIFHYVESIAQTSQPVLITGETGVGKELIARAIHKLSRLKGQLVAVNVAGLDDNVFSDTLFGHVRGAFTGADHVRSGLIEQAEHGSLFLDEIGDLSLMSQVMLLRLLQEGEYLPLGQDAHKNSNARIILSANKNLWVLQKAGKFREDLIYRLSTHHIHIPPLRERMDDLALLVDHFLEQAANSLNKKKPSVPKEIFTLLNTYPFNGNVRELQAMLFDAVSRHKSKILSLDVIKEHIDAGPRKRPMNTDSVGASDSPIIFTALLPTIKEATHLLISEAMLRANNVQSIAARMLGITHQALSKRLKGKHDD